MTKLIRSAIGACAIFLLVPFASAAETGFFAGGGIGSAGVDFDDPVLPEDFDETDFGWKITGGFNFDVGFDLGVEASYIDLGAPSGDIAGVGVELDTSGFDVMGTAGFDFGPLGVYGKLGYIFWDTDVSVDTIDFSDDGNDLAYGAGVRFNLAGFEIRGEYEVFDISDIDRIDMFSASILFFFL